MALENGPVNDPAIDTRGLRKAYGPVLALASLDLRVGPGEVVGLLGPNGAGKTTAVKLLLGSALSDGGAPARARHRRRGGGARARPGSAGAVVHAEDLVRLGVGGHGRGPLDDKALTALMSGAPRLAPSRTIGT